MRCPHCGSGHLIDNPANNACACVGAELRGRSAAGTQEAHKARMKRAGTQTDRQIGSRETTRCATSASLMCHVGRRRGQRGRRGVYPFSFVTASSQVSRSNAALASSCRAVRCACLCEVPKICDRLPRHSTHLRHLWCAFSVEQSAARFFRKKSFRTQVLTISVGRRNCQDDSTTYSTFKQPSRGGPPSIASKVANA